MAETMEDATKGSNTANSYATIIEADALLNTIYGAADWEGISDDDKSRLLITATSQLDELKLDRFASVDTEQTLNFPVRTGIEGVDGFVEAKSACIHQAFFIFENNDTIKEARAGKIQGLQQESIAKMKRVSTGFNPFSRFSPKALRILAPYIDMSLKIGRG